MANFSFTHPLDLTGTKTTNRVTAEVHTLMGTGDKRFIVPNYGAFFVDSLHVFDESTGTPLSLNDDYVPILYYEEPSVRSGKEVHSGIAIVNSDVSDSVEIEYQAVGGEFESVTPLMVQLIEDLDLEALPQISWGDIFDRPEFFKPAPHLHRINDWYGFETLVWSVERLRQSILYKDVAATEARVEELYELLMGKINDRVKIGAEEDTSVRVIEDTVDENIKGYIQIYAFGEWHTIQTINEPV